MTHITDFEWGVDRPSAPISVVLPTHPARGHVSDPGTLLGRAVASVRAQTLHPAGGISIACDLDGQGAAVTRQRALDEALEAVENLDEWWVSFIDSDDTWYPHHLETHWRLLRESGADVAHSWFNGNQPFGPEGEITHRGRQVDPKAPHHITMTLTVRASLAKAAGFLQPEGWMHPEWAGEDWQFYLRLCEMGAKFIGTPDVTWTYFVHHGNTSGLPNRGDAA